MKEEISYLERLVENAEEHDIDSYWELILKLIIYHCNQYEKLLEEKKWNMKMKEIY